MNRKESANALDPASLMGLGFSLGAIRRRFGDRAVFALRFLLAAVFVYAAIAKIERPYDFLSVVYSYRLLPSWAAVFLAAALPWVELAVGALLIAGVALRGCFLCAAMLAVMFTAAQLFVLHRGMRVQCGCFGDFFTDAQIGAASVARASALALLAFGAWMQLRSKARA